jgi:hypothetical protein
MGNIYHLCFDGGLVHKSTWGSFDFHNLVTKGGSNLFQCLLLCLAASKLASNSPGQGYVRIVEVDNKEVYRAARDENIVIVLVDVREGAGTGFGNCGGKHQYRAQLNIKCLKAAYFRH